MPNEEFTQEFPEYDGTQEVYEAERQINRDKLRKPSGRHTPEQRKAQKARWLKKNRSRWNAYMRERMKAARAAAKARLAAVPYMPEWMRVED